MPGFLGAGAAPAGSSVAGYGSPDTGIGQSLPAMRSTSLIDPLTRDYQYGADGNRVQGTAAQQMVTLAVQTALDSSCVRGFGLATVPGVVGKHYSEKRGAAYAAIFKALQLARVAKLLSVDIQFVSPTHVTETVTWQDLTTLDERVTVFAP